VRNVSLLVAIGVNERGYREILGICEGVKEDKTGWSAFLKHLKERVVEGYPADHRVCLHWLAESAAEFFSDAAWQRCVVRALVSQHLQSCALDQGAGDRGHAQGDPSTSRC